MQGGRARRERQRKMRGVDRRKRMDSLGADRPALHADTFLLSAGGLESQ